MIMTMSLPLTDSLRSMQPYIANTVYTVYGLVVLKLRPKSHPNSGNSIYFFGTPVFLTYLDRLIRTKGTAGSYCRYHLPSALSFSATTKQAQFSQVKKAFMRKDCEMFFFGMIGKQKEEKTFSDALICDSASIVNMSLNKER